MGALMLNFIVTPGKTATVLIVLMQKDSGPFHILFAECLDKEIANEVRLERRLE